jgi:uncharacterized surface protein with fasciclin (FAS1) repeats
MRLPRRLAGIAAGVTVAMAVSTAASPSASAHTRRDKPPGTGSLASVLLADTNGFDRNSRDYDVLTAAVLAVLDAKSDSAVGVLTDGSVALTAFLPNDGAFRALVHDLTGKWIRNEEDVFAAVASLGIPKVETVLLYHVVPGATITKRDALKANGAALTTAQGGTITVKVRGKYDRRTVTLVDADANDRNPRVIRFDINKGNRQIAHGINRVLRPVDLP